MVRSEESKARHREYNREQGQKKRLWLKNEATPEERELARQRESVKKALYYQRHREELIAKTAAWREANKDVREVYERAYRKAHSAEHTAYVREHNRKNRDDRRAYLDQYREDHSGSIRAYQRVYRKTHHAQLAAYRRSAAEQIKNAARRLLQAAVAAKFVVKPSCCEGCGAPTAKNRLHGHHHHGYDTPLEVQWLCSVCHGKAHRLDAGATDRPSGADTRAG